MANHKKATVEQTEATPETSVSEPTLEELKAKVAQLEAEKEKQAKKIEDLEAEDEGWLIKTPVASYNENTMGLKFTNGMAFIQKDRKFKDDKGNVKTADYMAKYLVSDFGYEAQYFKKEDWEKLLEIKALRAKESAEVQAKLDTQAKMMEKLIQEHRFA